MTATKTLAEACADVGYCSRDGAMTLAEARADVGSRLRDGATTHESAVRRTTVLARWRDDESAAGRKARGTPPACNHWRDNQQCLEQWEQDSLLPTARMLTEGLLARQRVGSGAEHSLAGVTTSRRQDG